MKPVLTALGAAATAVACSACAAGTGIGTGIAASPSPATLEAQVMNEPRNVTGYWTGTLSTGGATLPIGVAIERSADGTLTGTLDSPAQGAFDIPLGTITQEGDTLSIAVPAIAGRFEGEWNDRAGGWQGNWTQGGMPLPITLTAGQRPDREAASAAAPPPLPDDWTMPGEAAIAAILAERLADRPGAGIALAMIDGEDSRIITAGGGFDADTVFEIGSMTKVFTSILLAQMALDETVSLDDPVAQYLPEGATMPVYGDTAITLRNLSHHDSGLPRLPDNLAPADMRDPYVDYGEEQLLAFLASHELSRDVGSEVEYSNLGVGLLGYVLARAAGTDFETLLRQRILEPLGMDDTGITLDAGREARLATPLDDYLRPTSAWDLNVLTAAGGMHSTAADMQRFLTAALDRDGMLAPVMRLMASERRSGPGMTQGLGWMFRPTPMGPVAMHGGGTGGFRSHMAVQPSTGRAIAVMTNTAAAPDVRDISLHVLTGAPLAEAAPPPQAPAEIAREEVSLSDAQLGRVVGTYCFAPGLDMVVTRDGDQLSAALTGQGALPIYPGGPLTFFWRAVNAQIVLTEEDGVITGGVFTQDGNTAMVTKVG